MTDYLRKRNESRRLSGLEKVFNINLATLNEMMVRRRVLKRGALVEEKNQTKWREECQCLKTAKNEDANRR